MLTLSPSRVPDQNGVSLLYIMLEIHHSGREPSIFPLSPSGLVCCQAQTGPLAFTLARTAQPLSHLHALFPSVLVSLFPPPSLCSLTYILFPVSPFLLSKEKKFMRIKRLMYGLTYCTFDQPWRNICPCKRHTYKSHGML